MLRLKWKQEEHDCGGKADLDCGQGAGRELRGGAIECEDVGGKGEGAGKRKEIAATDACEEVGQLDVGGSGEENEAEEGEESTDGGGGAWFGGVRRPERGNEQQGRDEDDDESSEEGGFGWIGLGESERLEFVAEGEEEACLCRLGKMPSGEGAQVVAVDGGEDDGGEGETQQIEE